MSIESVHVCDVYSMFPNGLIVRMLLTLTTAFNICHGVNVFQSGCRSESLNRVLAGKRLILVLDLDHTLLTSTRNNEILDQKLHQKLSNMLAAQKLLPEAER